MRAHAYKYSNFYSYMRINVMFCFITSLKLFSDNIDDGWEYKSFGWGNNNHLGFFVD